MSNGQILPLSPEQLSVIEDLGSQGNYAATYKYIADQMSEGQIQGYTKDQLFWFREAAKVNANEESNPAAFFIRDMTRIGMGLSSTSDPAIQAVSNNLASNVLQTITANSGIPDFSVQLNDDIEAAINGSLTIGEWGGSFYFWNAPYTDPTTGIETTVGQAILSNGTEHDAFVANTAQALADTVEKFGPLLYADTSVLDSFKKGFDNFAFGGIESAVTAFQILNRLSIDVDQDIAGPLLQILEGGGTGGGIYAVSGSGTLAAGNGADMLFGGEELGAVGSDMLIGGSGSDTFVFSLPTTGTATETIEDAQGDGKIAVLATGQAKILGSSESEPLAAVQGSSDSWEDSDGTLYAYDPTTEELAISGGDLGSGNQILVENFDIEAATDTATGDSDGSNWTDEYQYASGGSPGAAGYSFIERYSGSDGSQGMRQYDASTGAITLSWDSTATGTLSGTTTDSGFIGLQNDSELTSTQKDLTFFNPNVSSSFNAFLAAN